MNLNNMCIPYTFIKEYYYTYITNQQMSIDKIYFIIYYNKTYFIDVHYYTAYFVDVHYYKTYFVDAHYYKAYFVNVH
jgi:hypothetical protein